MNLKEVAEIALKELGLTDSEIAHRLSSADKFTGVPAGDITHVMPGEERKAIDAFKRVFTITQGPEGQAFIQAQIASIEAKRKVN